MGSESNVGVSLASPFQLQGTVQRCDSACAESTGADEH